MTDRYKGYEVTAVDAHIERSDRVLAKYDIINEIINGADIQIYFFAIRYLEQLWSYCKLVEPKNTFLISSLKLGVLNKLTDSFKRENILDFWDDKKIKKMRISKWNLRTNDPNIISIVPKI